MAWETILAVIALLGSAAWTYGSASAERRANFKSWVTGHVERAKPVTAKAFLRLFFLLLLIIAGSVTWKSVSEVYDFVKSAEPITRPAVFMLLLSVFNALAYSAASFTCLLLLIKPLPKKKYPLVLTEGEPVRLTLRGDPDIAAFKDALRKGITVTVAIEDGKLNIETENLDGISLSQISET